ncbi:MAG: FHA domain-containing protein [Chloroflexi bacterium]|jgi:pSer/pThr/pTyr-binding forkhead associated (FHA) protein|nr:FHA domain-containing protein [Chloroflexota bacterium]
MPDPVQTPPPEQETTPSAFLIVDGGQIVPLDRAVITIGRKKDNQIIINNPHVSRHHAQIRNVQQRYLLVDLNSKVGCSVNGKRVEQALLKPGDVISIGGVPLIFGQGADSKKRAQENMHPSANPLTGPTLTTDLKAADDYLALFDDAQE